jgi:hypothetical protein
MRRPGLLDQKRPTVGTEAELRHWDKERQGAEDRYIAWLLARPVGTLTPDEAAFLDAVRPETPFSRPCAP